MASSLHNETHHFGPEPLAHPVNSAEAGVINLQYTPDWPVRCVFKFIELLSFSEKLNMMQICIASGKTGHFTARDGCLAARLGRMRRVARLVEGCIHARSSVHSRVQGPSRAHPISAQASCRLHHSIQQDGLGGGWGGEGGVPDLSGALYSAPDNEVRPFSPFCPPTTAATFPIGP